MLQGLPPQFRPQRIALKSPTQLFGRRPAVLPQLPPKAKSTRQYDQWQPSHVVQQAKAISQQQISFLEPQGTENMQVKGLPVSVRWDQRFSTSPSRIPAGFAPIRGTLPKGLSDVASHILNKGNPLGTYTPFTLDGKEYVAINEHHSHYAGRENEAPRKIYAITVFARENSPTTQA